MILPPVIHPAFDEDSALRPLSMLRVLKQLTVAFHAAKNSLAGGAVSV